MVSIALASCLPAATDSGSGEDGVSGGVIDLERFGGLCCYQGELDGWSVVDDLLVTERLGALHASEDGGATWRDYGIYPQDLEGLEVLPSGSIATWINGGLHVVSREDGGAFPVTDPGVSTWALNWTLRPADGAIFMWDLLLNRIAHSLDEGQTWTVAELPLPDPKNTTAQIQDLGFLGTETVVASSSFGWYRSTDGGVTWTQEGVVGPGSGSSWKIRGTPAGTLIVYGDSGGGGGRVSTDAATSWQQVESPVANFNHLTIAPDGRLHLQHLVSDDGGLTWQVLFDPEPHGFAVRRSQASANGWLYLQVDLSVSESMLLRTRDPWEHFEYLGAVTPTGETLTGSAGEVYVRLDDGSLFGPETVTADGVWQYALGSARQMAVGLLSGGELVRITDTEHWSSLDGGQTWTVTGSDSGWFPHAALPGGRLLEGAGGTVLTASMIQDDFTGFWFGTTYTSTDGALSFSSHDPLVLGTGQSIPVQPYGVDGEGHFQALWFDTSPKVWIQSEDGALWELRDGPGPMWVNSRGDGLRLEADGVHIDRGGGYSLLGALRLDGVHISYGRAAAFDPVEDRLYFRTNHGMLRTSEVLR